MDFSLLGSSVHGIFQTRVLEWVAIAHEQSQNSPTKINKRKTYSFYKNFICALEPSQEKAIATRSSTLAWKIPWMEEPGGLQSIVSLRLSNFPFTFHYQALEKEMATHSSVLAWRIPGTGVSLVGCRLWGRTESDMTEAT